MTAVRISANHRFWWSSFKVWWWWWWQWWWWWWFWKIPSMKIWWLSYHHCQMHIWQLQQDEDTRRRSPSGERKLVKQGNIPQNIIIPQVDEDEVVLVGQPMFRWACHLRMRWRITPQSRQSHPSPRPHHRRPVVLTIGDHHNGDCWREFLISLLVKMKTEIMFFLLQSIWPTEKIPTATSCHRKFQLLQLCRHWAKGGTVYSTWEQIRRSKRTISSKLIFFLFSLFRVGVISFGHNVLLWSRQKSDWVKSKFLSSHYCFDVLSKIQPD